MSEPLVVPRVPDGPQRILLRLPAWLGDVVMARRAIEAISAARPKALLTAECLPAYGPLAAALPGIAETVLAAKERTPAEAWRARRRMRAANYDAVVCFPRSVRAAVVPALARVPVRLGYGSPGTRPFLTHRIEHWHPWRRAHRSVWFGLLAQAFGATEVPIPHTPLAPPPAALEPTHRLLLALGRHPERPLVVLEPGASYGAAKCWPLERFAEVARRLTTSGRADAIVVGTAATRPLEAQLAQHAPGLLRAAGRTPDLGVLMGVLQSAAVVLSNDTGPMHLAAALGVPVVALFGASDPVVSSPLGPGPSTVLYEPEPCSPCFLRECPVAGHPCLARISVARALAVLERHLPAAWAN